MALVMRLLALIAVLLMPFGMAAAPAGPTIEPHSAAATTAEHCSDGQPQDEMKGGVSDCAMPCASALPAGDVSVEEHSVARAPMTRLADQNLAQTDIEIATPPPKQS